MRTILREDLFGRKPDSTGTRPAGDPPARARIAWEGDSTEVAGAQGKQRRGLGKLFREEKEEQERIKVEE